VVCGWGLRVLGIEVVLAAAGLLASQAEVVLGPVDSPVPLVDVRDAGLRDGAWIADRDWDDAAEEEYGQFVRAIGLARERKVFRLAQALKDPQVNPLYSAEDRRLAFDVDCATLPYALRVYFAYKTGRPFVFTANKGRRYRFGNHPEQLSDYSRFPDFRRAFNAALGAVSSGHFRMKASLEGTDTYPIEINKKSVVAGVNYYDPAGHVLVVYRVDGLTGDVYMMDGHPDGTLTLKRFSSRIRFGSSRSGAGFRRWRHDHVVELDERTGAFLVQRESNAVSKYFSATDQYRRKYVLDGVELRYHDWVRAILSQDGVRVDPVAAFKHRTFRVCDLLQARVGEVEAARAVGLDVAVQGAWPRKRPYGGSGEWGRSSSAVLDVRLRSAVEELRRFARQALVWSAEGSPRLAGGGDPASLAAELGRAWREMDARPECTVAYVNSVGEVVVVSLTDAVARLKDMSFDPYHCPEMRWGAIPGSEDPVLRKEGATCPVDAGKHDAWRHQARLRRETRLLLRPFEALVPLDAAVARRLPMFLN